MKKNYFLLAATTMMFAACAQTDMVNEVVTEEAPQAIGFDAFANKTTRAEINGVEGLKEAKFKVWGYKAPRTTDDNGGTSTDWADQQTVFGVNGTIVEFSDQMWKPTDTKYWDKMSNYNFYAAAPAEPIGATYSIVDDMDATDKTPGFITITGATSGKSTASNDFLITRGGSGTIDGYYDGTHSAVALNFHHTMAKLTFKLVAGIDEDITVTSLTMTGWDNGEGEFTQKYDATPISLDNEEWEFSTTATGSAVLIGTTATDKSVEISKSKTVTLQDEYIMVPQTIAADGLTFTLNYEIAGETYTAQVGKLAAEQVWGTDSHTTYTITVGPAEINFSVSVCDWDVDTEVPGTGNSFTIE